MKDSTEKMSASEAIGGFVVSLILMLPTAALHGFVASKLWAWFVVPTFQVFPVAWWQMIGVVTFVQFVMPRRRVNHIKPGDVWLAVIGSVVDPLFVLGLAAVYRAVFW